MTVDTVTAQLLYEIEAPGYATPTSPRARHHPASTRSVPTGCGSCVREAGAADHRKVSAINYEGGFRQVT